MRRRYGTVDELLCLVRETGKAGTWAGDRRIAIAADHVFGRAAIRRLGAERWFVNFSVAVTTCWILSELELDEYLAGRDVEFPVDVGALRIDWRVEPKTLRALVDHTTELACTDGLPASVRSLAGFIARRHLPQQTGAAADAARRELLTGRPTAEPGDLPNLSSAVTVIDWIAQASRRGPQLRLSYIGGPGLLDVGVLGKHAVSEGGGTPYRAALFHFIEFGYAQLWEHPEADALREVLADAYDWVDTYEQKRAPTPMRGGAVFTQAQDAYLRQIVIGRICKVLVGRSGWMQYWDFTNKASLLAFAAQVRARAVTARTRELADLLARLMVRQIVQRNRDREYQRALRQQMDKAPAFRRQLWRRVSPAAAVVGAAVGATGSVIPPWLVTALGAVALFLVALRIRAARRRSGFLVPPYQRGLATVSVLLALAYTLPMAATGILVTGGGGIGWAWATSTATGVLAFTLVVAGLVRLPSRPQLLMSDLVPEVEGVPPYVTDTGKQDLDLWQEAFTIVVDTPRRLRPTLSR
ncbi:hypothetical protein [Micromonospora taraxaci]|uniref:hypothetical protein n=1 Tax=Micromonospora taraxaci TaxID=1316803 RepID=UPI0033AE4889